MGMPVRDQDFNAALGRATLAVWGELPQSVQQVIFEHAASGRDEAYREALAVFLHDHHPRTADALPADVI